MCIRDRYQRRVRGFPESIMEPGAAAEAEAVPHSCQPTFVLKKWQAVAMWSWAISVDTCAICRNPLSEPSLEWQAGNETDQGVQIAVSYTHLTLPTKRIV
eukprot:TRINITY_DN8425_c0_g1_i6.p1 TRINITY_DN8425_c0_g1~~TRINITY_DN8425_c0_g1_i6.p1  ORF type:complete len:100 (-),score=19.28 TRINITY_DN8425_c0_g1_i6:65-364(-)